MFLRKPAQEIAGQAPAMQSQGRAPLQHNTDELGGQTSLLPRRGIDHEHFLKT